MPRNLIITLTRRRAHQIATWWDDEIEIRLAWFACKKYRVYHHIMQASCCSPDRLQMHWRHHWWVYSPMHHMGGKRWGWVSHERSISCITVMSPYHIITSCHPSYISTAHVITGRVIMSCHHVVSSHAVTCHSIIPSSGRRKLYYFLGTLFVIINYFFVFGYCIPCHFYDTLPIPASSHNGTHVVPDADVVAHYSSHDEMVLVAYYSIAASLFNVVSERVEHVQRSCTSHVCVPCRMYDRCRFMLLTCYAHVIHTGMGLRPSLAYVTRPRALLR